MAVDPGTIRTLFKTQLEAITGVARAHKYAPLALNEANCPQFLIVPAEAEHDYAAAKLYRTARRWRLILFLAPEGALPYGDLEAALDPFFERMENRFALHQRLASADDEMIDTVLLTDTGPGNIEYPVGSGTLWFGCEWEAAVVLKRAVTTGL